MQVLAFPCDQFGHQEPGSLEDIQAFAKREYNVTFPIFPKVRWLCHTAAEQCSVIVNR